MTVLETFKNNALADQARIAAATALPEGITVDSLRATYHAPSRPLWDYSRLTEGQQYIAIPTQLGPADQYAGSGKSPACNRYHLSVDLYDTQTGAYVCTHTASWLYDCAASFPVGYFTLQILRALSASDIQSIDFGEVAALVTVKKSGSFVNLGGWTKKWTPSIRPSGVPHEPTRDDIMAWFQSLSDEDLRAAYKQVHQDPSPVICETAPEISPEKEPDEYRYKNMAIRPAEPAEEPKKGPAQPSAETEDDISSMDLFGPVTKRPTVYTNPDRIPDEDPGEGYSWVWDPNFGEHGMWTLNFDDAENLPF